MDHLIYSGKVIINHSIPKIIHIAVPHIKNELTGVKFSFPRSNQLLTINKCTSQWEVFPPFNEWFIHRKFFEGE